MHVVMPVPAEPCDGCLLHAFTAVYRMHAHDSLLRHCQPPSALPSPLLVWADFQTLDDQILDLVENWDLLASTGMLQVGSPLESGCQAESETTGW